MQPCLHVRNFDGLPVSLRKVAMAAANGSIDDFQEIAFLVGRAQNSSQSYLFVPVCWANLDPSGIPTPTELDILLESSGTPDLPKRPFLALQLIQILLDIPAAASIDLCAWAWPWMSFLVTYRGILRTSPAALNLYDVIFTFIGCIPVSTLATLSGFRFLAFKVWKDFTATQDTKARGFPQLLIVLNADLETNDDARVEDYTEGAGGSIEDLASIMPTARLARSSIFCRHLRLLRTDIRLHVVHGSRQTRLTAPDFIPQDDWEVHQVYYEARARKDPRIKLHAVTFPGHSRIFPMRQSHARNHEELHREEELMRIARRRRWECTSDSEEVDGISRAHENRSDLKVLNAKVGESPNLKIIDIPDKHGADDLRVIDGTEKSAITRLISERLERSASA
ncbi:hypothetical protein DFH09DRAFT_1283052 [Mycena vulgaris]|nr:hypothetical protein DFH09DRAFT_1283052 [Mycena vulgaris]